MKLFLFGGTGNQLFQLSRALELRKTNTNIEIVTLNRWAFFDLYKLLRWTRHSHFINLEVLIKEIGLEAKPITFNDIIALFVTFMQKKMKITNEFDSLEHKKFNIGYYQKSKFHQHLFDKYF